MSGTPKYDRQKLLDAAKRHKGSVAGIADEIGCAESTVRIALKEAGVKYGNQFIPEPEGPITLPSFPDSDIPITDVIEQMKRRFEKRQTFHKSKTWFPVKVNIDGPIGLTFWGDPHVDDNGCNWPLLHHHCDLHRENEALFSVNIGDSINGWMNRLVHLYSQQDSSEETAHRLAKWFLTESGVRWLCILWGNHDLWSLFPQIIRASAPNIPAEDWQARFRLAFPNGREAKIWASHDFAGNSMWNSLHGPQKAAHTKAEAHIYACGHKHNWAIHQEESASRDFTYWLIRSRGYKHIDHYGEKLGHFGQDEGSSITCIINPDAKSEAGFIQAFADMDAAADYLTWLRS